ncbi:MAG: hypothetical protein ACI9UA_000656, partial [Pseudoalteromonas tetraodonis]
SKSKPIVLGLHAWALLFDFEIEVTPSPAAMGFPDSLWSFSLRFDFYPRLRPRTANLECCDQAQLWIAAVTNARTSSDSDVISTFDPKRCQVSTLQIRISNSGAFILIPSY